MELIFLRECKEVDDEVGYMAFVLDYDAIPES